MRVVVCTEQRFDRSPDGAIWTHVAFDYSFWRRYLEVFDSVCILARVRDVAAAQTDHIRVDGDAVAVAPVPCYLGPWEYLRARKRVQRAVLNSIRPADAVILRVGSQLGNCLFPLLQSTGRPFGVEVVGDPWDVFAPGAIAHPLRPFFRWHFWRQLRRQCASACAASYVTERALQARYPAKDSALTISASTIELRPEATRSPDMRCSVSGTYSAQTSGAKEVSNSKVLRLVFVGSLAQLYKGPDVLLDACSECASNGLQVHLTMIGDGKYRLLLEKQAAKLGIADCVLFRGQLPAGAAVREELDKADIFVLPSRTEGLPRAMIEAMARSLPCIGANVGGIPELLPDCDLVPAGDARALARKIQEVASDANRMEMMSQRNYEKAMSFRDDILRGRRIEFFKTVHRQTINWRFAREAA